MIFVIFDGYHASVTGHVHHSDKNLF